MQVAQSNIEFHVGGVRYTVSASDVTPETTLNTYLRDKLHLTATKKMCLEGGCGTCIVAVEELDSEGNRKVFAVNSCLVSIFSCHGWKILTNEGIGNSLIGYNKIQKILAQNNGSQCGFCSSGMVMNMYALKESGKNKTEKEVENSFGSNLCRCTGYRPILTAFKQLTDIEDIMESCLNKTKCPVLGEKRTISWQNSKWMKVYNLNDLLEILGTIKNDRYMLVAGNTARGVYWLTESTIPQVYIDITGVIELTSYTLNSSTLVLGANMNLTDTMDLFRKSAKTNSFGYLDRMADHIDLVAHVPVRNIGTIAGNLMIKHQHNEFPSDIFLILETVKAILVIVDVDGNETRLVPSDFLKINMDHKVIKQVILSAYGNDYFYSSYKIMPRAQNAHAMLNAGFLFQLDGQNLIKSARMVYGAISPTFVHAAGTESLLQGKQLFDNAVLQAAFKSLDDELKPDWILPDPRPDFRKQLAINLFYKYVLSIAPASKVNARNRSGGTLLERPVSKGSQQIYSKTDLYPLTEPILKLEALAQTTGEAKYLIDMPDLPGQLFGYFVKAQAIPGSKILTIDAKEALKSSGVVAFYAAEDIPGKNSIALDTLSQTVTEEIFCSSIVQHFSQPVGLIVATSHEAAKIAAELVTIKVLSPSKKPLFTVQEVLQAGDTKRVKHQTSFVAKSRGTDIKHVIKGTCYIGSQYHFHMENQNCHVVPTEDGLNIFPGSQWMDHIQGTVSQVLNVPSQKISIFVRRLGGAFGAKITRNAFVAAATALAAFKLQKPVKMWMNFEDNMDVIGKRYPLYTDYEVGVNDTGVIQYLKASLYTDFGIGSNEPMDSFLVSQFQNCYVTDTWTFDTYTVNTDKYSNCYTRAPGSFEGLATIENIFDHIAYELKLDPLTVRRANLDNKKNQLLIDVLDDLVKSDDIANRKSAIEAFNNANRWKKKGIAVVPMRWTLEVIGNFTTLVSIYHLDGGVAVSHAGIEMGQGINTKVAQVCAYKLGIPIEKVSIKPSYNVASPNSSVTGGSLTSEAVVYSLIKACDVLLNRIKPVRDKNPTATWEELIQKCYSANICLSTNGFYSNNEPEIAEYPIFGACALEVEVDILTGKYEILRVDMVEDVGQSMSPLIDIGQLEGGFIMGLGAHSTEELIYNGVSGQLLTNRTWTYKPPGAKDIPQIFNVRFVKNSLNPVGVLKSKAVAEPPTCLSVAFPLAIRNALASARKEASPNIFSWYPIDGPSTVQQILLNTLNDYRQFAL